MPPKGAIGQTLPMSRHGCLFFPQQAVFGVVYWIASGPSSFSDRRSLDEMYVLN
jgi:hypothetical protein